MVDYADLAGKLSALSEGTGYSVTVLANASAMIYEALGRVNWCGFYIMNEGKLKLGPFQGKVACTEIAVGRGVCGTAAAEQATVVVPDVHEFAGHIACDSASNSEIVVPVFVRGELYGVLDIDSTEFSRFGEGDRAGLELCVRAIEKYL